MYEKGIVLVVVMLVLLIVSLLALNLLNSSLLETKMSNYYQNKACAFYRAENYLSQYEQEILGGGKITNAEIIDTAICGVTFYRVFASVTHNTVLSKLQSTLAKIDVTKHCNPKPKVKETIPSHII